MQLNHALNDTNQRPPKPELAWRECDWCDGMGRVPVAQRCTMCRGYGGWWQIASADPNKETAGANWLNALWIVGLLIVQAVAG